MRNLGHIGERSLSMMTTLGGSQFRGTIMPASDQQGSAMDFSSPRLILRVQADALAVTREIIVSPTGEKFIVGDHYAAEPGWRSHRLLKAEQQMAWKRPTQALDAITKLPKAGVAPTDLGLIWVTTEMPRRQFSDPGLKVPIEKMVIVTNSAVKANDTLDGQSVTRINRELGLYILEIH